MLKSNAYRVRVTLLLFVLLLHQGGLAQPRPQFQLTMDQGLMQNSVFDVEEDTLGAIWIGTPGGLCRYNGYDVECIDSISSTVLHIKSIGRYVYCTTLEAIYRIDAVSLTSVSHYFESKDYHTTQFTDHNIYVQNSSDRAVTRFDLELKLLENEAVLDRLPPISENLSVGKHLIASSTSGVWLIQDSKDSTILVKNYISQIINYDNRLMVGSHAGLIEIKFDELGDYTSDTLISDRIDCMLIDRNEHLYIGTSSSGLLMFHRNTLKNKFHEFKTLNGNPVPCWSIGQDDDVTYVATSDGVKLLSEKESPFSRLEAATKGQAYNSLVFRDQFALLGSGQNGVYRWKNNQLLRVFYDTEESLNNMIVFLLNTESGFIACSKRSILTFDGDGNFQNQFPYTELGLDGYVMSLLAYGDEYLACTTDGVHRLDHAFKVIDSYQHKNARVFNQCVNDLCVSMDGGLFGLSSDSLSHIQFADKQLIGITNSGWILSTTSAYFRDSNGTIPFNRHNGFTLPEYDQSGLYKNNKGNLFLSGLGGVFELDPTTVLEPIQPPKIRFSIDNDDLHNNSTLDLDYDERYLFAYAEPIITSDQNRHKAFWTNQVDTFFIDEPQQLQIPIEYGHTSIMVGILSHTNEVYINRELSVSKAFPFWMRWWFYLLSCIGLIGLFIGSISLFKYIQTRRLLKIQQEENKVNQERLRISKELHDNIGARLTHIISSLDIETYKSDESKSSLENINAFARETMSQLRQTIWAVSDKTIFLSEFAHRLEQYASQSNQMTRVSITYEGMISTDFELNPVQTINYFRIVQEAINNSLKYAKASNIVVTLSQKDSDAIICISDDGVGFDTDIVPNGSGIKGMKARCSEAGGSIELISKVGEGTMVKLKFG